MSVVSVVAGALAEARQPGDFCTSGVFDWRAPAISVEGAGQVALPLLEDQAKQLIGLAEFAPFGRRDKTVVDPGVRNCWQIDAERVTIAGGRWNEALAAVVTRAAEGLGVEGAVQAVFYKLLIYEPGGFFLDHRDTEKLPGMFATLIVAPPGRHAGGELIVRHGDREARFDLQSPDPAEAAFAAFYADCPHEVRPVESGYRLVLVYNLVRKGKRPEPPDYQRQAAEIAAELERWRVADEAPQKIIYTLEHAYTPAELSFAALKGADQAAAQTLGAAALAANCDLCLALLTIEESGAAEYSGNYGRRGRADEVEYEAGEVFDRTLSLDHWRSAAGEDCDFPTLPFDDEELSPPGALGDIEPDEEYFGEATGNEGASFERTYRRAALVVWPSERIFSVIAGADLDDVLTRLESSVERASSADDRARAAKLADAVTTRLAHDGQRPHRANEGDPAARVLDVLLRLDDIEGVERCLDRALTARGFRSEDVATISAALSRVAEPQRARLIGRLFAGAAAKSFAGAAKLLLRLAETESTDSLGPAAAHLSTAIATRPADDPNWRPFRRDPDSIADALAALQRIDDAATARAVAILLADRKTFPFDETLAPALRRLAEQGGLAAPAPAIERLRAAILDHLRSRAGEPLAPPADWRRPAALGCKCQNCADFSRFLDDPARKDYVLRAAESARSHLEQQIRAAACDIDVETLHKGRPYSLVCKKNQASYGRRAAQRQKDLQTIALLETQRA